MYSERIQELFLKIQLLQNFYLSDTHSTIYVINILHN